MSEGMVSLAILVLAMVATLPAVLRQQITNHMAGSVHTSDAWKHRDSMENKLATSCVCQIRLDAQRAIETQFKCCDHQCVSSGSVRRPVSRPRRPH